MEFAKALFAPNFTKITAMHECTYKAYPSDLYSLNALNVRMRTIYISYFVIVLTVMLVAEEQSAYS